MASRALRIALLLLVIPSFSADAQIPGRLRQKVKAKVEQATDKAVDKGLQVAEDAIRCAVTDQACIDKAKAEGKEVALTDDQGTVVEVIPAGEPAQAAAAATVKPGEGAWANYDFVPGERVLFFEDFTADRVGNFPKRLEFVDGNMEVVEWEGRRWVRVNAESAFQVPLPDVLPDRFTMEFEVTIPWGVLAVYTGDATNEVPGYLQDRAMILVSQFYQAGVVNAGGQRRSTIYPDKVLPAAMITGGHRPTAPVRVRVHVDGAYTKVYLEEHRVANVPTADLLRADKLVFHWHAPGDQPPLITDISINAGAEPMYDALMADGRFVTQGILFDTGSDKLRPESTPTLEEIAAMLEQHPELRVRIEGHTDAVGDDAANLQLSDRRAAAVKDYLITKKGVEAGRLEPQGLGETVPVGSNDTPEGRQQNRRVELVRLQ